ncbi:general stress protein [Exiguobacterium antarcticum]|uniref:General stress protein n=1 Tax=Exiguobacterium antarcticum TaxID=132920 RepID=A0ABT6R3S1_9BACL|nr:general stress protein [Exiguobacterium antarcticum]AFS69497.1 Heat induced stress protein YflT [Exiguobacterium antarcticum B7]MDI3235422.1 general stress protein [Exiguobacterium antarcticum]
MGKKQLIGTYENETDLIRQIEDLHFAGYLEEDLYVVLQDKTDMAMLRGQSAAQLVSGKRTLFERFTGKGVTDEETRDAFHSLGLKEGEVERHVASVRSGAYVLLADEEGATRPAPEQKSILESEPEGIEAERKLDHENRALENENDRML